MLHYYHDYSFDTIYAQVNYLLGIRDFVFKPETTEIPFDISVFQELTYLDLNNTNLTEVPPNIDKLSKLEELLFAGTQIKELPITFAKLKKLEEVSVSHTPIVKIPQAVLNATKVYYFNTVFFPKEEPTQTTYETYQLRLKKLIEEHAKEESEMILKESHDKSILTIHQKYATKEEVVSLYKKE